MSVLLITYDLSKPRQEYSDLHKTIETFSPVKLSESSYAIKTDKPVDVIYSELQKFIYKDDYLLVVNIQKPFTGKSSLMK